MRGALTIAVLLICEPVFAQAVPTGPALEGNRPVIQADTGAPVAVPARDINVPSVPETDEEAEALLAKLLDAAQNGHWLVVGGLALLLLVFFLNRMGLAGDVGRKWVPFWTLSLGVISAFAVMMLTGGSAQQALTVGLIEGAVAIALWEAMVKHLTSKKSDGTPR